MSFTFTCGICGQELEADDDYAGKQVNCPACGKEITVPEHQEPEEDDSSRQASLEAEKKSELEKQAELEEKRDALQKELNADVTRLKELIVTKIKLGDYESAFNFARDEYCTEEDILVFLLEISYRDHNYDKALEYAEKLIEKSPDSSVGYRWKAEILDDGFGSVEESIRCSTKAIELNPKDTEAYVIRGNTKRWMTPPDLHGATADYMSAIKIDRKCSQAFSGIGWIAMNGAYNALDNGKQQDVKEMAKQAEEWFQTAIGENKGLNYGAWQGLAAAKELLGASEDEFLPLLDMAIKLSPRFKHAYIQRAKAKLNRDTPPLEEIIQDYARAIAFTEDSAKIDRNWLKELMVLLASYFKIDEN